MRSVARHFGVQPSTIMRWCRRDICGGFRLIPTKSSRPKTSPNALRKEIVEAIIKKRVGRRRCGQVIHQELMREGIVVSLPSVQRTLDRCHLLKKRSVWKRPHDFTERPKVFKPGALIELDTIHVMNPYGGRIYIYTMIDLFSRWAYAEVVEKIGAEESVKFISRATRISPFTFEMVQTDHGTEFTTRFTHGLIRLGIKHRHCRVRHSNDNAHVERFNRTIQEECLDQTTTTISSFRIAISKYLPYYNSERLHMGLNYQTPQEVLQRS
jgi:transposase InsO family protein